MIKRTIFFILCLIFSHTAFAENGCKLISRFDNDFWLVDDTGKLIQRLTNDGVLKSTATFSPDGQYIAYSSMTDYRDDKAIVIIDHAGRELSKIIVQPQTDIPDFQDIRWISRLLWEEPNILWSVSSVGKNGGFIDIWELDSSLHYSHKKRIAALGGNCELSPSKQYVACIHEVFENDKFLPFLMIYDTSKRGFPEFNFFKDRYFEDKNPHVIELKQMEYVDKIRFTPDNANVIIIGGDKKYKFNMLDNKLSEIKELPPDVKIKSIPKAVKIKKGDKELSAEVFDMYCGQDSAAPK